jgi:RNA polymerase sigma-70 factor, ECF subfamily
MVDCAAAVTASMPVAALRSSEIAREASVNGFVVIVAACIKKLDSAQGEILNLRTVLHHSYDEIARTLGINVGTVKSRNARARGNLRGLLVEACPEFSQASEASDLFEPMRGASYAA